MLLIVYFIPLSFYVPTLWPKYSPQYILNTHIHTQHIFISRRRETKFQIHLKQQVKLQVVYIYFKPINTVCKAVSCFLQLHFKLKSTDSWSKRANYISWSLEARLETRSLHKPKQVIAINIGQHALAIPRFLWTLPFKMKDKPAASKQITIGQITSAFRSIYGLSEVRSKNRPAHSKRNTGK